MILLLCLLLLLSRGALAWATPDEEFVGPFASWANVKTVYGAAGNGTTDDTAVLQTALNELGTSGHSSVLYFPAGTYKITGTIYLWHPPLNVSVIGADPATTVLKWAGASNGIMFWPNGMAYSRINRLTFDGSSSAQIAVYQAWDNGGGSFDTGNEYADDVFQDVQYGIMGGDYGYGFAETSILRAKFLRNTQVGLLLKNFNALDIWVWDSLFDHCNVGISNTPGAGNWRVYNSVFLNSTVADVAMSNTGVFSARGNTSYQSTRFLTASSTGNPAEITLHGNTILDPVQVDAIKVSNQGPVLAVDNTIRSAVAASGNVMLLDFGGADLIAVGNTLTTGTALSSAGRIIDLSNTTVARSSLTGLTTPTLPPTPPNNSRTIYEVASGASAATIQAAITSAVATGNHAVVHLPSGAYSIATTLTIPTNTNIQLLGDGGSTVLTWTGGGSGPVLKLVGPTQAVLRDFEIHAAGSEGIRVEPADQAAGRLFFSGVILRESTMNNLLVNQLDYTSVELRNTDHRDESIGVSVSVIGGALANAGTPATGATAFLSGSSSSNVQSYTVSNGGSLLVRDVWYETSNGALPGFLNLSSAKGTLTVEGQRIALPANSSPPALQLVGWQGKATFLSSFLDDRIVVSGSGSAAQVLVLGMLGPDHTGAIPVYVLNTTSPAGDVRVLGSRDAASGSTQVANSGAVDSSFVTTMLAQSRGRVAGEITTLGAGVLDARFYRVSVAQASVGVHLVGAIAGGGTVPLVLRLVR